MAAQSRTDTILHQDQLQKIVVQTGDSLRRLHDWHTMELREHHPANLGQSHLQSPHLSLVIFHDRAACFQCVVTIFHAGFAAKLALGSVSSEDALSVALRSAT